MNKLFLLTLFFLLIHIFQLKGQNDSIPLPNWEIFYGDSLILKSNADVRIPLRPTATIEFKGTKDLKVNVKIPDTHQMFFILKIKFLYENAELMNEWGFGADNSSLFNGKMFLFENGVIKSKLYPYKGKKIQITYEDDIYQKTPTTIGYLIIR